MARGKSIYLHWFQQHWFYSNLTYDVSIILLKWKPCDESLFHKEGSDDKNLIEYVNLHQNVYHYKQMKTNICHRM